VTYGDVRLRLLARFDRLFDGAVPSVVYAALRIALSAVFLVRNSDWLRPFVFLEHHRYVHGLMFYDSAPLAPALESPWLLGVALSTPLTRLLVGVRTALSIALLLGVRAQLSAALLGLVSLTLVAADRYRYYHHLYLLYISVLWLSLAPIGARWTLARGVRWLLEQWKRRSRTPALAIPQMSAAWPLQLLRALTLSVYVAAGVSKLTPSFLRGDALRELEGVQLLEGSVWLWSRDFLGYRGVALLSCAFELTLPCVLCFRSTRRPAVVAALVFHVGISASMPVYSFGVQMAALLLCFWVERVRPEVVSQAKS